MEYTAEKKNFAARITADDTELLNEFLRIYETNNRENELKTDREVFTALLESAISRKKPVEVSRKEDIALMERLQNSVNSLQAENENLKTEVYSLQAENENLKTEVYGLQAENSELKEALKGTETANDYISGLENELNKVRALNETLKQNQKTVRLVPENEITILLNDFQLSLIRAYLQNKEVLQLFKQANRGGELNGMLDIIDGPEEKHNIANLLTTTFVGSAYQKVLKPIFSTDKINQAFKKYKTNTHESSVN